MSPKAEVFSETYDNYLGQIAGREFPDAEEMLGIKTDGADLIIQFLGKPYRVSPQSVSNALGKRPNFSICIILFKYLLMCPSYPPQGSDWVPFRQFKDARPLLTYFRDNVEQTIAKSFAGKSDTLVKASQSIGGTSPAMDLSYDVIMRFDVLPKVPVLMLFNDGDAEFAPACNMLFEKRAEHYLDPESLAIAGAIVAGYLKKTAEE